MKFRLVEEDSTVQENTATLQPDLSAMINTMKERYNALNAEAEKLEKHLPSDILQTVDGKINGKQQAYNNLLSEMRDILDQISQVIKEQKR